LTKLKAEKYIEKVFDAVFNFITPPEIIQEMLKKAVNKAIEEYNRPLA
jgi:hypothetical protein